MGWGLVSGRSRWVIVLLWCAALLVGSDGSAGAATGLVRGSEPVVVIGVAGLRWDDVSARETPNLWGLAGRGGLANMSTRAAKGSTCPADGWLTFSAGQRAALDGRSLATCSVPAAPSGGQAGAVVPDWPAIRAYNTGSAYAAKVGLLGSAVHGAGGRILAVGPGAALGAADETGRIDAYAAAPDNVPDTGWSAASLAVVDLEDLQRVYTAAGTGRVSTGRRAAAVRAVDHTIGTVLAAIPPRATVLLAGIADTAPDSSLHSALMIPSSGRYLTSSSTRRTGLVTLTDLTATVLSDLRIPVPGPAIGRPWRPTGPATGSPAATGSVAALRDANRAALVATRLTGTFRVGFVIVDLLLYIGATMALRRDRGHRMLTVTRLVALGAAALPLAAYLVNVLPWWRSAHPAITLLCGIAVADALVVGCAAGGRWRRGVVAPGTIVASLTAVVFAADVMTGSRLQLNSMAGYSMIVAGRFYGFGNTAFPVFAASVLLASAAVAQYPVLWARRGLTVSVIAAFGAAGAVITAWPGWGAKFGGTIAFVPGVAVTTLMIAGRRATIARLATATAAGVVVIMAFAFADHLRPASRRTHLGVFAGQILDGEALTVVRRKAGAMLGTLGYWPFTVMTVAALLFLWLVLVGTDRRSGPLALVYERAPAFRGCLAGAVAMSMIGFAVEDSGITLPALGLAVAVPLALAAGTRARQLSPPEVDSTP